MKKRSLKNISLTLALMQLLSTGAVKAEKTSDFNGDVTTEIIYDNFNIYANYTDPDNPYYLRYNPKSGKCRDISIFDEENIYSGQYGGNQKDFRYRVDVLLDDPLIIAELEQYFPAELFDSEETAKCFYKRYFKFISKSGCGYIAVANYVFDAFKGKEKKFEKVFGFPMYTVTDSGYIDFNYELFILKFFNFSIIKMENYSAKEIVDSVAKDMYADELDAYIRSDEYSKKLPDDCLNWTQEEWDEWHEFEKMREEKWKAIYQKWVNASNSKLSVSIPLDSSFGYFCEFMHTYNLDSTIAYEEDAKGDHEVGDIIASYSFELYQENSQGERCYSMDNVNGHYMYITKITQSGKIYVSSWGDEYIFDESSARWTSAVRLSLRLWDR